MIIADLFNVVIVDEILEERFQIGCDFDLVGRNDLPRPFVDHRVNVKFEGAFEHAAERFQNPALQIEVVFLVKDLQKTRDTHDQSDQTAGVTGKVSGEPVVFAKLRNQDCPPKSAENIDAC